MGTIEKEICFIFNEEFDMELKVTDNLNENGVNSIMFTQFMVKLEQCFSINFPDDLIDIYQFNTLGDVANLVKQLRENK